MSKKLAIKGHPTRGKEVIELLEMMGGINVCNLDGKHAILWISNRNNYICNKLLEHEHTPNFEIFTLEEFYAKYPFNVGDKVLIPEYESEVRICKMQWDGFQIQYKIYRNDEEEWYTAEELLNYNDDFYDVETQVESTGFMQLGKTVAVIFNDANYEDEVELQLGDYEIVVRDGKTYAVRKKPVYPKTYKECFNICFGNIHHIIQVVGLDGLGDNKKLFESFIKLKVCRDAYWKIYGEQMGLGKPWEPNWNEETDKFTISIKCNKIYLNNTTWYAELLSFPTAEMRDAFLDNFKDLIESCKELL